MYVYIMVYNRNTQTMRTLNTYLQTSQAKLITEHIVSGKRKGKKKKKEKTE